ncbi:hypothetical protein BIW11_11005, partial [Tropilaelaps mercedesae]
MKLENNVTSAPPARSDSSSASVLSTPPSTAGPAVGISAAATLDTFDRLKASDDLLHDRKDLPASFASPNGSTGGVSRFREINVSAAPADKKPSSGLSSGSSSCSGSTKVSATTETRSPAGGLAEVENRASNKPARVVDTAKAWTSEDGPVAST